MKDIYIMACQRGQKLPELHYITDDYRDAIRALFEYYRDDDKDFLEERNRDYDYWFMHLYRYPLNENFKELGGWSNVKLGGKSSEYRIKFDCWGDLIQEYDKISRKESEEHYKEL